MQFLNINLHLSENTNSQRQKNVFTPYDKAIRDVLIMVILKKTPVINLTH